MKTRITFSDVNENEYNCCCDDLILTKRLTGLQQIMYTVTIIPIPLNRISLVVNKEVFYGIIEDMKKK